MKIHFLAVPAILAFFGLSASAATTAPTRKPVLARKAAQQRRVARAKAAPRKSAVVASKPVLVKPPIPAAPQPMAVAAASTAPAVTNQEDERVAQLRNFFLAQRSPLAKHAEAFLGASDKYGLDWRLLPSLAMVETGGLIRANSNNNVFGWGNGRIKFSSIADSIHVIAERLTNALPYRNKNTEDKLRAYNPVNKSYAAHVQGIMTSIGPAASADLTAK